MICGVDAQADAVLITTSEFPLADAGLRIDMVAEKTFPSDRIR
ncbi:MAG: hypothetical protein ACK58L_10285 [Planctomycetota bacterium]